jgi:hypothetical protein
MRLVKPPDVLRAGGGASLERLELAKVHPRCALRFQIGVQEICMAYFVQSITGYVLRTIAVEIRQAAW